MSEIRKAMLPKEIGTEPDWTQSAIDAVNEIREAAQSINYDYPRNRHERRKAAALYRRATK